MVRAKYDEKRFTFELREDGSRTTFRPNEILVRYEGNLEVLQAAFNAADREGDENYTVEKPESGLLRPDRVVNENWGVITLADGSDPRAVVEELIAEGITAQLNNVYFVESLEASAGPPTISAAPNYAVPNYAVPNYAVPNYAVPNYAVPNYAVPNYAVPNYAVPNYAVGGGGRAYSPGCIADAEIPPTVPSITARKARVPLEELRPNYAGDMEIHVLDVRPQLSEEPETDGATFVDDVADAMSTGLVDDGRTSLIEQGGALLPEALFLHRELKEPTVKHPEILDGYLKEPFSVGLGANVNADNYVDPTTNHGGFIKGIIDRIIRPVSDGDEQGSFVKLHSVMGTLGDVSDAELVAAMSFIDEQDGGAAAGGESTRIMSLSLAGYPEVPEGAVDCLAEEVARLIDKGWILIASAGNNGSCRPTRPASLPEVISVGAYGPNGPAWFSNYGPWVDACAPGVDVVSDFENIQVLGMGIDENTSADDEFTTGYASWSGTSFAAPFVAAIIARWMLKNGATFAEAAEELLHHDDALQFPGYGTIVSFATTRTRITQSGDWV